MLHCHAVSAKAELNFELLLHQELRERLVVLGGYLALPQAMGVKERLVLKIAGQWEAIPMLWYQTERLETVHPFTSFKEEKEFNRFNHRGDDAIPWGLVGDQLKRGIAGVVTRLNRLPFTYTCGWSCSDLPSDHSGGDSGDSTPGAIVHLRIDDEDPRSEVLSTLFHDLLLSVRLLESPFSTYGDQKRRLLQISAAVPRGTEHYEQRLKGRIALVERELDLLFPELADHR